MRRVIIIINISINNQDQRESSLDNNNKNNFHTPAFTERYIHTQASKGYSISDSNGNIQMAKEMNDNFNKFLNNKMTKEDYVTCNLILIKCSRYVE